MALPKLVLLVCTAEKLSNVQAVMPEFGPSRNDVSSVLNVRLLMLLLYCFIAFSSVGVGSGLSLAMVAADLSLLFCINLSV